MRSMVEGRRIRARVGFPSTAVPAVPLPLKGEERYWWMVSPCWV